MSRPRLEFGRLDAIVYVLDARLSEPLIIGILVVLHCVCHSAISLIVYLFAVLPVVRLSPPSGSENIITTGSQGTYFAVINE